MNSEKRPSTLQSSVSEISPFDTARERLKEQAPTSPYLTVGEAAVIARCNPATIRRAIARGTLPAFRRAHRLLLKENDVRAWIESAPVAVKAPSTRGHRRGRPGTGSITALREIEKELSR